ncbi:MAG: hypothetical protein ABI904_05685 [Chloroflexota bacterium]
MGYVYRSLGTYEPLIYISLAILGLFVFRRMWVMWREWRNSVYTLEREFALGRLGRATALGFLVLGLFFVEFYIATFVAPSLPASDLFTTPTLDLLASPQVTLPAADATQAAIALATQPVQTGMSGCVKDKIMITSPVPGADVSAVVDLIGTADIPDFGFYKYEIAVAGTQNWKTVSAERQPKKDELLGKWNTLSLSNGDYFLRLVITDNVGASIEPCVIAVRVLNQ